MKSEIKVGIFVFSALVMLFLMSTQINRFNASQKRGYTIEALLGNAAGLEVYAKVKVNGVESGHVSRIYLVENQAYGTLFLEEGIRIPADSRLVLAQESMLSGRYVEIIPGESTEMIAHGGRLIRNRAFSSLDQTSDSVNAASIEFKRFIHELRGIFTEESRQNLTQTFANLQSLTKNLNEVLIENRHELKQLLDGMLLMTESLKRAGNNIADISMKFNTTADAFNAKIPKIMNRVDSITMDADAMLHENRQPLHEALKSVDRFFYNGNRVVNRLDDYLSLMEKSEIEVAMRAESMMRDSYTKSYASLQYRPNPTRYYMFEVAGGDDYSRIANGEVILPKRRDKEKFYFSAQIGKRYDDLLLRAGIVQSSGGVGADYFLFNEQIKSSIDLFDFSARNDVRGTKANLRASLRWTLLKHIDLYFGMDNILNQRSRNGFAGIGVRFIDDDIKRLIGGFGSAASIAK